MKEDEEIVCLKHVHYTRTGAGYSITFYTGRLPRGPTPCHFVYHFDREGIPLGRNIPVWVIIGISPTPFRALGFQKPHN